MKVKIISAEVHLGFLKTQYYTLKMTVLGDS